MIDLFIIFNKHGLVLFKHQLAQITLDPIEGLIKNVLLEEKKGEKAFMSGTYAVKWVMRNDTGVVFAAVYNRIMSPPYVSDLLDAVSKSFITKYKDELDDASGVLDYEETYKSNILQVERARRAARNQEKAKKQEATAKKPDANDDEDSAEEQDTANPPPGMAPPGIRRISKGAPGKYKPKTKTKSPSNKDSSKGKAPRKWGEEKAELTQEELDALDRSTDSTPEGAATNNPHLPSADDQAEMSDEDDDDQAESGWNFGSTAIGGFFKNITGNTVLSQKELEGPLEQMEQLLVKKNVATEVARKLCESVGKTLEGQKLASFTRVSTVVREAFEEALMRILTPKKSIDVLREALLAKEEGRVYSVVFIGVNGVGKSTSLAKTCYYLKQKGLKVMLVACDTFRSGAVEQLKVHARAMDVPIFERGYVKDPASVAIDGIKYAEQQGYDVVLIDTAGRMQNNEPLMRALAKLVSKNDPDLVLFVGEALAGNDGVDQLMVFSKSLKDFSQSRVPRLVDGIVLTKFDTIGDKVGAAISMVHMTGQPIIFVGTGQKYTNLNRLNVRKVVRALLE